MLGLELGLLGGAPTPVEVDVEEDSLEGDASLSLQEDRREWK